MARAKFKIKGMKKFIRELNKEVRELKGRTQKGLIEAAIELQREAEPGTPVDLGNLRSSWFIVSMTTGADLRTAQPVFKGDGSGEMLRRHGTVSKQAQALAKQLGSDDQPVVIFGYSANYAPWVHESVDANFKRPGAKARWLYAAMQKARGRMLQKIQQYAKF